VGTVRGYAGRLAVVVVGQLVILDFDGTLAHSFPLFKEASVAAAHKFGLRVPLAEDEAALRQMQYKEVVKFFGIPFWKLPWVMLWMKRYMLQNAARIPVVEGWQQVLQQWQELGVAWAIVSSNRRATIEFFLRNHHLPMPHFWATNVAILGKQRYVQKILNKSKTPLAKCCYVGDEVRDVQMAKRLGLKSYAVVWGYNSKERLALEQPDAWVHTPTDLLDLHSGLEFGKNFGKKSAPRSVG
jgi:phosphoglycolate phosphatase